MQFSDKYYQFYDPENIITICDINGTNLEILSYRNFFIYDNNILIFVRDKNDESKKNPDRNFCYFKNMDPEQNTVNTDFLIKGDDHYSDMNVFGKHKDKFYVLGTINLGWKSSLVVSDFIGNVNFIDYTY